MALTRDQIKAIQDIVFEEVEVPQWNDTVWVRSLTAEEQGMFKNSMLDQKGKNAKVTFNLSTIKAVRMGACKDQTGEPLFQKADEEWLRKKNSGAVQVLFNAISRLSGLSEEDLEELKTLPKPSRRAIHPPISNGPGRHDGSRDVAAHVVHGT